MTPMTPITTVDHLASDAGQPPVLTSAETSEFTSLIANHREAEADLARPDDSPTAGVASPRESDICPLLQLICDAEDRIVSWLTSRGLDAALTDDGDLVVLLDAEDSLSAIPFKVIPLARVGL
jgi:hypothetical protein